MWADLHRPEAVESCECCPGYSQGLMLGKYPRCNHDHLAQWLSTEEISLRKRTIAVGCIRYDILHVKYGINKGGKLYKGM
jgi:hypothetical protein